MKNKHVIILGAGASASARFPLGSELANSIQNLDILAADLEQAISYTHSRNEFDNGFIRQFVHNFDEPIKLFRESGFTTVDEFSKLAASGRYAAAVQDLKFLIRLALAIPCLDPNKAGSTNDYSVFIQGLFERNSGKLRDDVCVLTYNYDPYLEFFLARQFLTRNDIRAEYPTGELGIRTNAIHSGFELPGEVSWNSEDYFCILKLHGSIVFPGSVGEGYGGSTDRILQGLITPEHLFCTRSVETIRLMCCKDERPPIVFPFELFSEDGSFIPENEVSFPREALRPRQNMNLQQLLRTIWERAQAEVANAYQISFIGISFHEFLEPGLRYLFAKRDRVCITPILIGDQANSSTAHDADGLSGKLYKLLCGGQQSNVLPIKPVRALTENASLEQGFETPRMTARNSFREFIEKDLPWRYPESEIGIQQPSERGQW